jgi:prepilin-type N-terminal cleavage/methylation domain-containing protein
MSHKVKGFTLVELLVVIAVFGVIMGSAMALVPPVRRVFNKGYTEENVSSSAQIIGNYLDQNLRYAENIVFRESAPDGKDLIDYVNNNYSGGIYKFQGNDGEDQESNFKYISGNIYVMKIDNTNSGQISRWDYTFTAGDRKVEGVEGYLDAGKTKENKTDDVAPTVKFINKDKEEKVVDNSYALGSIDDATNKYAVNRAIYDEQNYNISLGIYQLKDDKLEKDTEYYNTFPTGSNLRDFGRENCGFTITVYPKKKKSTDPEPRTDDGSGKYIYNSARTFNQSFKLQNVIEIGDNTEYLTFNWTYDDTSSDSVVTEDLTSGSKLVYKNHNNSQFNNNVSNAAESPAIYIIYSYREAGTATT